MDDIYKEKYLKYKAKYLALKNKQIQLQIGGDIYQYPYGFNDAKIHSNTDINTAQLFITINLKKTSNIFTQINAILRELHAENSDLGIKENEDLHLTLLILRLPYDSPLFNAFREIYLREVHFYNFYADRGIDPSAFIAQWQYYNSVDISDPRANIMKNVFETSLLKIFMETFYGETLNSGAGNPFTNTYSCFANNNFVKTFDRSLTDKFMEYKSKLFYLFKLLIGDLTPTLLNIDFKIPNFSLDTSGGIIGDPDRSLIFTHYSLPFPIPPNYPGLYDPSNSLFTHTVYFNDDQWTPHLTLIPINTKICTDPSMIQLVSNKFLKKQEDDYDIQTKISKIKLWDKITTETIDISYNVSKDLTHYIAKLGEDEWTNVTGWGYLSHVKNFHNIYPVGIKMGTLFSISKANMHKLLNPHFPIPGPEYGVNFNNPDEFISYYLHRGIEENTKIVNTVEDIGDIESIKFHIYIESQNKGQNINIPETVKKNYI